MKSSTNMSIRKNSIVNTGKLTESKWDSAIQDAEEEIELLAKQKERLENAVCVFKANKRDGIPWPGERVK